MSFEIEVLDHHAPAARMLRNAGFTVLSIAGDVFQIEGEDRSGAVESLAGIKEFAATLSLEQAKLNAREAVLSWIDDLTAQITRGYSADEVRSWASKAVEARKYISDGTIGHVLQAEADATGEDVEVLANLIRAKSEAYETIIGTVSGLRRVTFGSIDSAQSETDVQAAMKVALSVAREKAGDLGLRVEQ